MDAPFHHSGVGVQASIGCGFGGVAQPASNSTSANFPRITFPRVRYSGILVREIKQVAKTGRPLGAIYWRRVPPV
jgi:hypothetical protein